MKLLIFAGILASTLILADAVLECDPNKNINNRCQCTTSTNCKCKTSPPIYAPYNKVCSICPINDYCTTCSRDFVCKQYNDGKCIDEKGPNAKTNVAGNACFQCNIQNCQRCKFTNACQNCKEGYKINTTTGLCVKIESDISCPGWCDVCFINSSGRTRCAQCHEPLRRPNLLYTACFQCAIAGCLNCNSSNYCSKCLDTYSLSKGICNLK